ncbi:MAG: glycosyltransferase family 4 protein [Actinobacteria bacterium]|nr:glycosyltransferase family 4 protein [Actinomycetota bacterium]
MTKQDQRVLILLQNGAINKDYRVQQEIFTLLDAGYKVSLICPASPDGVEWNHDGVKTYFYQSAPESSGPISYLYEYQYSFILTLWLSLKVLRETGFDIIHACNPPDFFFILAMLYKPLGKKFVFDQHDLTPELYLSRFSKPSLLLYHLLLFMEHWSYKVAEAVITTNESYKRIAIVRGKKKPEQVFVVRNGPYYDRTITATVNPALKNGREYMVCCIGEISPQDGVEYLILAANQLTKVKGRQDITFNIVGSGASLTDLKRMVNEFGIEDYVNFPGWISDPRELYQYLVTADVCVSPEPKNPLNDHSTFIKVLDYLAAGKPIVAFSLKETRVSAGEAALYALPNDEVDFAEKIGMLLDDPDLRSRLGNIGRKRINKTFDWEYIKPVFIDAYRKVTGVEAESRLEKEVA